MGNLCCGYCLVVRGLGKAVVVYVGEKAGGLGCGMVLRDSKSCERNGFELGEGCRL
jgi:hypothetical protein